MSTITILQISTSVFIWLTVLFFILNSFRNRRDPYDLGLRHLRNNRYEDSVASFSKAIKNDPTNINAYDNRAKAFIQLGLLDKALEDAEIVINDYPESNLGYRMRSRVQKSLGDKEALEKDLNLAVDIEPQTAEEYQRRISAYTELNQIENAIKDTTHLIDIMDIKKSWNYQQRGMLYAKNNELDKAIQDLDEAYQRSIGERQRSQILQSRFSLLVKNNQLDKALKDADELIYINPNQSIGYLFRAKIYQAQKDHELVIQDLERAIHLDPSNKVIFLALGMSYSALSKFELAIGAYSEYIKYDPNLAVAYNSRAWAKPYVKDYYGSLVDAKKAIALDDSASLYFGTQGQAKWLMKDHEGALQDFKHALELDSKDIYQLEVAIALLKLDKQDKAISLWQEATSEDAEFQSAEAYQEKYRFAPPFYEAMQDLEKLAQNSD